MIANALYIALFVLLVILLLRFLGVVVGTLFWGLGSPLFIVIIVLLLVLALGRNG